MIIFFILVSCIPVMLLLWGYMKLTDQVQLPKHHKNSDYIDESFKFNFMDKRVKGMSGEGNNEYFRKN